MTKVRIEPILGKTNVFDPAKYKRAIENAGNETAKAIKVDFLVTTRTWQRQPDFKIEHTPGKGEWTISTDNEIYGYVSEGTPRHPIEARNGGRLAYFKTGFRPKSRVGWIGSNAGAKAKSDFRRPKMVMHPGIKAREYPKAIKEKWDIEWPRQLSRAIRAANRFGR